MTTPATILPVVDAIRQLEETIQQEYWTRYRAHSTAYNSTADQLTDGMSIGKLAEAQAKLREARSLLGHVKPMIASEKPVAGAGAGKS